MTIHWWPNATLALLNMPRADATAALLLSLVHAQGRSPRVHVRLGPDGAFPFADAAADQYASCAMEGSSFEQDALFRALAAVRAVLIGRAALVAYGLPVLTADYDVWLHIDDIDAFNASVADLGLVPNRSADEARARGRYVLENDERVDVVVARTFAGLTFADVWARREVVPYAGRPGDPTAIAVALASITDLIQMKLDAGRPKDLQDVEQLRALLAERSSRGSDG